MHAYRVVSTIARLALLMYLCWSLYRESDQYWSVMCMFCSKYDGWNWYWACMVLIKERNFEICMYWGSEYDGQTCHTGVCLCFCRVCMLEYVCLCTYICIKYALYMQVFLSGNLCICMLCIYARIACLSMYMFMHLCMQYAYSMHTHPYSACLHWLRIMQGICHMFPRLHARRRVCSERAIIQKKNLQETGGGSKELWPVQGRYCQMFESRILFLKYAAVRVGVVFAR